VRGLDPEAPDVVRADAKRRAPARVVAQQQAGEEARDDDHRDTWEERILRAHRVHASKIRRQPPTVPDTIPDNAAAPRWARDRSFLGVGSDRRAGASP